MSRRIFIDPLIHAAGTGDNVRSIIKIDSGCATLGFGAGLITDIGLSFVPIVGPAARVALLIGDSNGFGVSSAVEAICNKVVAAQANAANNDPEQTAPIEIELTPDELSGLLDALDAVDENWADSATFEGFENIEDPTVSVDTDAPIENPETAPISQPNPSTDPEQPRGRDDSDWEAPNAGTEQNNEDPDPTPVRGRDDSDWEAPGANDTDTNDGTIDGEGGGPPPLADVDWDRLEQTASSGDQASDVIYDSDLEQTPPTTPGDLLAGGSPDDAFANPEPPESSFTDAVGDTLEDIGDALESAWEDRGAQAVGAAASASFMTYANLNGWTEKDWLDESHEQSIASFVVNEVAQDIVTFDFSAGDFNLFEWNAVNANGDAVAGTGANMIASLAAGEIASELGLGGTDLASSVGTSMAVAGMQYTISTGENTAQTQPSAPPRLCFSVREPLKVNNNWGQVVETPRLGEARTVAVRQGQATAPLGVAA